MDFESISLAARTQCHVIAEPPLWPQERLAFNFFNAEGRNLGGHHFLCDCDIVLLGLCIAMHIQSEFDGSLCQCVGLGACHW